ncbi:Uma2 family endonuclease [Leptolyngbya sp. AN03gr2]|uniref:Uma2 family endonuclease n=1 Tax=unclassified Leptolyngbya TaxID=2650499 RepID=UPI003D3198E5
MIQALRQTVTFDQFIEWYPENSEMRYELHQGVIVEVPKPRGPHSYVAGFVSGELNSELRQLNLPYAIPRECIVRSADGGSGYEPDGIVLDKQATAHEPRWNKSSVIENGASIKLILEVVSTNWRDDYFKKFADYEALGIQEYWIVDYAAIGGRRFLGNPKQPAVFVCSLEDGEYEMKAFRGDDRIVSPTFPELTVTAAQVFAAQD